MIEEGGETVMTCSSSSSMCKSLSQPAYNFMENRSNTASIYTSLNDLQRAKEAVFDAGAAIGNKLDGP